MTRVKTGIPGFDKLVKGGLPEKTTILLCGTPGTAKSIFSLQYIYNGAFLYKEKGLYVSFEQTKKDLIKQTKEFGMKVEELEKKGLMHMICVPVKEITNNTFERIVDYVKENKIKRLVIDSLSTLSINAPMYAAIKDLFLKDLATRKDTFSPSLSGDFILKRYVYTVIGELQELDVTSILISETANEAHNFSRDEVSEFMCDGIIQMSFESMGGQYSRSLLVRKMRHTHNDEDIHPVEIGKKGIIIHNIE